MKEVARARENNNNINNNNKTGGGVPQIKIEVCEEGRNTGPRAPRVHIRENKVAPQVSLSVLENNVIRVQIIVKILTVNIFAFKQLSLEEK